MRDKTDLINILKKGILMAENGFNVFGLERLGLFDKNKGLFIYGLGDYRFLIRFEGNSLYRIISRFRIENGNWVDLDEIAPPSKRGDYL